MDKPGCTVYKETEQPPDHKDNGDDIQNTSHDDCFKMKKNIQRKSKKYASSFRRWNRKKEREKNLFEHYLPQRNVQIVDMSLRFERKGDRKYGLLIHFGIHFYYTVVRLYDI